VINNNNKKNPELLIIKTGNHSVLKKVQTPSINFIGTHIQKQYAIKNQQK